MYCPKCGAQNPDDGLFCRSCGASLAGVSAALASVVKPDGAVKSASGKKPASLEAGLTKLFMGIAFTLVAVMLGTTGSGRGWWFWLFIPAFSMLATGIAQLINVQRERNNEAGALGAATAPENGVNIPAANGASVAAPLPPAQTEFVAPPRGSIYETGEFVERPSVVEETTRHLVTNTEGETMTLPTKKQE